MNSKDTTLTNFIFNDLKENPKSSFVVISLLIAYKLLHFFEWATKISLYPLAAKIVSFFFKLPIDQRFVLEKLNDFSKPVPEEWYEHSSSIEMHNIISHEVVPYYIMMVKSFQYFSRIKVPVVAHEDGSLTEADCALLERQLPDIRILRFDATTARMEKVLKDYPMLLKYRLKDHMNKINLISTVDIPFFSKSKEVFYIDGDIVFFNKPTQICEWFLDKKKRNRILYTEDAVNGFALSKKQCEDFFGVGFLSKFNMGILCYSKRILDLEFLNEYFSVLHKLGKDDAMLRDQTYFMILFQKIKPALEVLDPQKYLVYSLGGATRNIQEKQDDTICCHYTHDVRHRIYKDSVQLLFKMKLIA